MLHFLRRLKRITNAALKPIGKLLKKRGYTPSKIVTDKLKSNHKAFRLPGRSKHRWLIKRWAEILDCP
ncbi:hypothetical protein GQF03_10515 [Sneathiella chungangensis]|uniref:Uncharacterized protein n=1 Tax=Sneathiella chungangensis TaxID=1418234 RepID=A0A845MFD4_9PROT|nr:hypothetical protein [Sneathiella chungangensis]